jgi:hypothetical protein
VVVQMLAHGPTSNLFRLQEQHYQIMAADYARVNVGREFPLAAFSERVYQMRPKGETSLPEGHFLPELQCMYWHNMVLIRRSVDAQGQTTKERHFRHDKIMAFFIGQRFLSVNNDRPQKHLGCPRFRGIYFLLPMLLPLKDIEALRERLINYAADTKDYTVSDTFIQLLRMQKAS